MTETLLAAKPATVNAFASPDRLARWAVEALLEEVNLPGKPGLVGPDGERGHSDMDIHLMRHSARTLESTFGELAHAGMSLEVGQELRDEVGRIGRHGEEKMMAATGGVNTHRGAIWNLGLMVIATAGLAGRDVHVPFTGTTITQRAGRLASIRDSFVDNQPRPGASVRKRYRVGGAVSEAASGFPHVLAILQAMGRSGPRDAPYPDHDRQLRGLLTSMSSLDDTCILHRGGNEGLNFVQGSAAALIDELLPDDRIATASLAALDEQLTLRRLSPGGSADLLACALFLTSILGADNANDH
ncbi:triphosphoribosyl-dephospho-CoA synthase [Corynebacterium halotolerans]|uniref:triphosphoribosyl-dephospho-CoA synthase n=1 Tax=Corynebacterium halotolerans YIM 70093 = DSM 44683 TaxID=1121362 RepID=M1P366_9CORY|nr:triphosphoribosyl-dephospho-CoA synthase [Corynebacterium halotolerans]AGF71126.1 hypothetical protein A605_00550 [Corynebacterium halotolerans YIM 70093 = DSM 44683]